MRGGGPSPGPRRNNLFLHVVKGAAGGLSTVEDLVKFAAVLQGHKLLDAERTDLVLKGKVPAFGPDARYGYGFVERGEGGKRVVGHGGGFPVVSGRLDIYRDQGYVLAVLSNYDGPPRPLPQRNGSGSGRELRAKSCALRSATPPWPSRAR